MCVLQADVGCTRKRWHGVMNRRKAESLEAVLPLSLCI
jgi:hypothetical protein